MRRRRVRRQLDARRAHGHVRARAVVAAAAAAAAAAARDESEDGAEDGRCQREALVALLRPEEVEEDGAWMLWENSSVVAAAVAHPDWENGQFSSFITKSELPECADRSVLSSGC